MIQWQPIVIALVGGATGSVFATAFGFLSRRDEKRLRIEAERELEANVRAHVARDMKRHEARLRIATEARLRLTERVLTDVGGFRVTINTIGSALRDLGSEAWKSGASERTAECMRAFDATLRACVGGSGFVPSVVRREGVKYIHKFEDEAAKIAEWSKLPDRGQRLAPCKELNDRMQKNADDMAAFFDGWIDAEMQKFTTTLESIEAGGEEPQAKGDPAGRRGRGKS